MRTWPVNVLLSIISIIVSLIVLEIGIRAYDAYRGFDFFSSRRSEISKFVKVRPFRTFGFDLYRDGKISSRHGEQFPQKKGKGVFRIVVFGGSTTENINAYRESKTHYPAVLQDNLSEATNQKVEVINVANGAYATPHSLILLSLDVISWDPDLVILSHNINDLFVSYWPNFTFDYSNKYSNDFYNIPDLKKTYTVLNIIFQHSQLYWVLKKLFRRVFGSASNALVRKSYGPTLPDVALDTFKRNLRTFIGVAQQNGIDVILGTQPLMTDEGYFIRHFEAKPYNAVVVYPLHSEFVDHHNIFNDAILSIAEQEGVYGIDNSGVLQESDIDFVDSVHYTSNGVIKLGTNYSNFIIINKIIN